MDKNALEARVTRRNFLKMAGIGTVAITALGGASGILAGCNASSEQPDWDLTTDVVIVGSGAAALAAAVTARNQGASVVMLEKSSVIGGTTAKSGGVAWIPNNFALRNQGIQDNKDDCLRLMAHSAYPQIYNANDSNFGLPQHEYNLLAAFYDNSYKAIDHFMEIGACQFTQASLLPDYVDHAAENKVLRGRGVSPMSPTGVGYGSELIRQMSDWINSHNIQVLTGHQVTQIVLNDKHEVTGVVATTTGNDTQAVQARKAVIFGSGGFTHNPELIIQFQPGPLYGGCAVITNEGDFVYLAQSAGAQLSSMNTAWNAEIPLEPALQSPSTPNDIWQPAGDSMVLVNKYGLRVVNEKRSYNDRTKVHFYWDPVEQEYVNQILLMIYDQRSLDLYAGAPGGYPMPAPGTSAPHQISGQTLSELGQNIRARIDQIAEGIGSWRLDSSFENNLEATVNRFNDFASTGIDLDFKRGAFPYDVEWHENVFSTPAQDTDWPLNDKPNITMYPFASEGPYYCILIAAGTLDTCGGPRTNGLAQVLDTKENPIPGLYGAGNCIAAPTRYYFGGGATIGPALAFGYIAGINAVNEPVR